MAKIQIDMIRREKLRQLHTSAHILNYSSRKILGDHVWQNGSNIKEDIGTLDITHYDNLSFEEIAKIEELANKTVFENKKVSVEEIDRGDAEKKYGFTLYQGGAIPQKILRVVKIVDSDIEACGGIHMQSTGGIGLIKIIEATKIQDGVIRLKFVANTNALEFVNENKKILDEASNEFSVESKQLPKTAQKFFKEWKEQKKEIENLKNQLKQTYINQINSNDLEEFKIEFIVDMGFLMEIFSQVKKDNFKLISSNFIVASSGVKVEKFKKEINKGKFSIYII